MRGLPGRAPLRHPANNPDGPGTRRQGHTAGEPDPGDQWWVIIEKEPPKARARLFHVRYTLRGASYLLHRIGFSPQVRARRAAERDEAAIAAWRAETWAKVRG